MGRDPSSIPHASPAVRKLARELGVDLTQVEGSAEHGRITEEDLKKHVKSRMENGASAAPAAVPAEWKSAAARGRFREIRRDRAAEVVAYPEDLRAQPAPQLGDHPARHAVRHRRHHRDGSLPKSGQAEAEEAGTKMTPLVFLIKAVVAGLKKFRSSTPRFPTTASRWSTRSISISAWRWKRRTG